MALTPSLGLKAHNISVSHYTYRSHLGTKWKLYTKGATYLGSSIDDQVSIYHELNRRVGNASAVGGNLEQQEISRAKNSAFTIETFYQHHHHPMRVQLLICVLVKSLHPLPATSVSTLSLLMLRMSPRISLFQGPSSSSAVVICAHSGSSFIRRQCPIQRSYFSLTSSSACGLAATPNTSAQLG